MYKYEREIYSFINTYFKEFNHISEFHLNFFLRYNIKTIDLNIYVLHKFIFQAFNFLKDNLNIKFSPFLIKLYKDIDSLIQYLHKFEKKSEFTNKIFEVEFLPTISLYRVLNSKIEENKQLLNSTANRIASIETELKFFIPKTKEDEQELKRLRGRLVDAIHFHAKAKEKISEYTIEKNNLKTEVKTIFVNEFNKAKKSYISKFYLIINTKLYYFNKKMWIETRNNKEAIQYFDNLGINKINLNTYIQNSLKHLDITKSKYFEEYSLIQDVLKELYE